MSCISGMAGVAYRGVRRISIATPPAAAQVAESLQ
jgi:hypothetical protein